MVQSASQTSFNQDNRPGRVATNLNYGLDDRAFDESDKTSEVYQARKTVLQSKQEHRLGVKQWNTSTSTGTPFPDPSMKRELSVSQSMPDSDYNYRSEVITKRMLPSEKLMMKKSTSAQQFSQSTNFEQTVNPKLDGKEKWNLSTELNVKDLNSSLKKLDESCKENLKRRSPSNYVSPVQNVADSIELSRSVKEAKRNYMEMYGIPIPTEILMDMFPHLKVPTSELPLPKVKGEHRRRDKMYSHPGVWNKTVLSETGWAWSCCMNDEHDSEGCLLTVVNPDAWNFATPNAGEY
eukprot:Rmarinus@m.3189